MKKRILSMVLVLALCLGLLPAAVLAAPDGNPGDHTDHTGWTELTQESVTADGTMVLENSGKYFLGGDIVLGATQHIPADCTVTLCLNGHILDLQEKNPIYGVYEGSVLAVDDNAELNLCDCSGTEKTRYGFWSNEPQPYQRTYTIQSEVPSAENYDTLTGGIITGGTGEIDKSDGSASGQGGGIYVDGTLNFYGGCIAGNRGNGNSAAGGGICLGSYQARLHMLGGNIVGNFCHNGGGIAVMNGEADIEGGAFCSNLADSGGGIYCVTELSLSGPLKFSGNAAVDCGSDIALTSNQFIEIPAGKTFLPENPVSVGKVPWNTGCSIPDLVHGWTQGEDFSSVLVPENSPAYVEGDKILLNGYVLTIGGGRTVCTPAYAGMEVELEQSAPPENKGFDHWEAVSPADLEIRNEDGHYRFFMPAQDTEIQAVYKDLEGLDGKPIELPRDVKELYIDTKKIDGKLLYCYRLNGKTPVYVKQHDYSISGAEIENIGIVNHTDVESVKTTLRLDHTTIGQIYFSAHKSETELLTRGECALRGDYVLSVGAADGIADIRVNVQSGRLILQNTSWFDEQLCNSNIRIAAEGRTKVTETLQNDVWTALETPADTVDPIPMGSVLSYMGTYTSNGDGTHTNEEGITDPCAPGEEVTVNDDGTHTFVCRYCGQEVKAPHDDRGGFEHIPGTETHAFICSACGEAHGSEPCTAAEDADWDYDNREHWKYCEKCGAPMESTAAPHTYELLSNHGDTADYVCTACSHEIYDIPIRDGVKLLSCEMDEGQHLMIEFNGEKKIISYEDGDPDTGMYTMELRDTDIVTVEVLQREDYSPDYPGTCLTITRGTELLTCVSDIDNQPAGTVLYTNMPEEDRGDWTALDALIASVPRNLSEYTPESVLALQLALSEVPARVTYQKNIDAAHEKILAAKNGLTEGTGVLPTAENSTVLTLTEGQDLIISRDGYRLGDGEKVSAKGPYLLSGTGHSVRVEENTGVVSIALDGLTLNAENCSPMAIGRGSAVDLILVAGSENSMDVLETVPDPSAEAVPERVKAAGLHVPWGTSLLIRNSSPDEDGKLTVQGGNNSAGIGGNSLGMTGNISILSGNLHAATDNDGAGIGGGYNGGIGAIKIYGGTIYAEDPLEDGSGIGTGDDGFGGTIEIFGGNITACAKGSGDDGTGIGGGDHGGPDLVYIAGGTIRAEADDGAAIGGGDDPRSKIKIVITGGDITAISNDGAAIGFGDNGDGDETSPDVEITGGILHLSSDDGAAIGGGRGEKGCCITVSNAVLIVEDADAELGNDNTGEGPLSEENFVHLDNVTLFPAGEEVRISPAPTTAAGEPVSLVVLPCSQPDGPVTLRLPDGTDVPSYVLNGEIKIMVTEDNQKTEDMRITVAISGVKMDADRYVSGENTVGYDKTGLTVTNDYDVTKLLYLYNGTAADGTEYKDSAAAPDRAGLNYTLTVQVPETDPVYAGELILPFDILPKHVEAVAATYEKEGNIEYWYCPVSEMYFADEKMTKEITLEDTVIPVLKPAETAADHFIDITEDAWYYEMVNFVFQNGLFGGMSEHTFEPETPMSRAMLVTVLWRMEGEPKEGENIFTDVADDQWFAEPVAWAAHNEIVNGIGDQKFAPEDEITREQMAAILYRYANWKGIKTEKRGDLSIFPDGGQVSTGWALEPVQWAVGEGLIGGSDGKLLPQGPATRAQVATILMRFIQKTVNVPVEISHDPK